MKPRKPLKKIHKSGNLMVDEAKKLRFDGTFHDGQGMYYLYNKTSI